MESAIEDLSNKLESSNINDRQNKEFTDCDLLNISKEFSTEEINTLLDKLYIEMLDLTEQHIRCKVEMEKRQNEGNMLIAKARYIQGGKTVSIAQLPSDESTNFNALVTTTEEDSDETLRKTKIVLNKHTVDKNKGYVDPMKWFGVLVPRSLHFAKERYQFAIDLVLDAVNVQQELLAVISYIDQLKRLKRLKINQ